MFGKVRGRSSLATAPIRRRSRRTENPLYEDAVGEALRALSLLNAFGSSSSVGLGFVNSEYRIVRINSVLAGAIGGKVEELSGQMVPEILPALWPKLEPKFRRVLERGEELSKVEVDVDSDPIRTRYWLTHYSPVRLIRDVIGVGIVAVDITEQKELEVAFRKQSMHDALTGLPNKALFLGRAERFVRVARRDQVPVSVLFIDLDNFKTINDWLGHSAGDQLLIAAANRITDSMLDVDTVCRFGGDEFVVLVNPLARGSLAEPAATRVMNALRPPFDINGQLIYVTASIGIATGHDLNVDVLVRNADIAMYQAKAAGKNSIVTFTPRMQTTATNRLQLEIDLHVAMANPAFILVYQPIVNLENNNIEGVEALVRWDHPLRGRVMPGDFVPHAEENGMILDIGRSVLREACFKAAGWQQRQQRLSVSVNLSARQLESAIIVDDVRRILGESGLDPQLLVLEITETTIMRDPEAAIERLNALKGLGVRIAIDDFGTGYSSLSYLRKFPVDILKIDRSFISGLETSPEQVAIVHSLIELGKALGLEIIAEGVELDDQRRMLEDERCPAAQGYLLARPLESSELEELLGKWGGGIHDA